MAEFVYLNGDLVEADQARVSVFDSGILHGAGLFETMRAYNGVIFQLANHLARLKASAEALSMFTLDDETRDRITTGLAELLRRNRLTDARVRLTVTSGDARRSFDDDQAAKLTVMATAVAMNAYPAELYEKGMTVVISGHKQSRLDPTCGFKTLNYLARLISLREAQARDCHEALWFTYENLLAEGAISNVFIVSHGVVKTPPIDTPVLPGITRMVVIQLATASEISVQETPLTINDLLDAGEVFLTNSLMEVMPVGRVEARAIADGKPGPIARRLAELYRHAVAEECNLDAE